DAVYWAALLSASIGILAGFQGIYERFKRGALRAAISLPGLFYLLTRGGLPYAVFLIAWYKRFVVDNIWFWAMVNGAGTEAFLRARVYVKQTGADGKTEELLKGPFDLLKWYQNLFLDLADDAVGRSRLNWVKRTIPKD